MLAHKPAITEAPKMMNKFVFFAIFSWSHSLILATDLSSIRPNSRIILHKCMFDIDFDYTLGRR